MIIHLYQVWMSTIEVTLLLEVEVWIVDCLEGLSLKIFHLWHILQKEITYIGERKFRQMTMVRVLINTCKLLMSHLDMMVKK
jgi:hypothetical protein